MKKRSSVKIRNLKNAGISIALLLVLVICNLANITYVQANINDSSIHTVVDNEEEIKEYEQDNAMPEKNEIQDAEVDKGGAEVDKGYAEADKGDAEADKGDAEVDKGEVEADKGDAEADRDAEADESRVEITVKNYKELEEAITKQNTIVNLENNIVLEDDLTIKANRVKIDGRRFIIDGNNQYKLTVSAEEVEISNVEFENYKAGALAIYNAKDTNIDNVTFNGKDMNLDNDERSTFGLDIYNSSVKLKDIETFNHLYRGIQVRNGSTVEIKSKNTHMYDSVHMQVIQKQGEEESTVDDKEGCYLVGTKTVDEDNIYTEYFSKVVISISNAKEFQDNITNSGNVLQMTDDITFDTSYVPVDQEYLELVVSSNVVIEGNGKTIDLGGVAGLTFKGNDIKMNGITVKNSADSGLNIYNSRNILLEEARFIHSQKYGLMVNGSTVTLKNVHTGHNIKGGILITRSRTLDSKKNMDSVVTVEGAITHIESNINVELRNLQMVSLDYFQDNKFIVQDGIYDKYINDEAYKELSEFYLEHFGISGEDAKKKYREQSTDYMVIKEVLDVTTQDVVLDDNQQPIRLVGDGQFDNTENFIKLLEYSAEHGIELFFPSGVYKITGDINLEDINLPALSNFKINGEENGLSIIDGSSATDRMLRIVNIGYHAPMNYINIENMVFNNVGIEFNGVYKKGITVKNNVFMNGKYTKEYNDSGVFYKATMTPYITANNSKYIIEENAFLRGNNYPGRGIATYRTKNVSIKNNFFGDLSALEHAANMLPVTIINKVSMVKAKSSDLSLNSSQGNFFTCINNERYDTNVTIANNYFRLDATRNINSDFGTNILIGGINVAKEGQRRDHIIYSKSYDGLNIYGNYFEGMQNDASGGIKIRNGKDAYIGSNYLKNVPVLAYIYGDLTKDECILYNTTIYNNIFHETRNFGKEGTGILYYQSYRDGEDVKFNDGTWTGAFGDVQNFIIYNNKFIGNDVSEITISNRPTTALGKGEFVACGNVYYENQNITVNYDRGNVSLVESTAHDVEAKVNDAYAKYNTVDIPLMPPTVDYSEIVKLANEAKTFYKEILNNKMIADKFGYYSPEIAEELKNLLEEVEKLVQNGTNQWEVNDKFIQIEETLARLKDSLNDGKVDVPTTPPNEMPGVSEDTPTIKPEDAPVNPEDIPSVLPDDAPVDPEDIPSILPDDAPVDPENIPSVLPDDAPVDPEDIPSIKPDDAPVDPEDIPSIKPDDAPVDPEDIPSILPDDVPVDSEDIPSVDEDVPPMGDTENSDGTDQSSVDDNNKTNDNVTQPEENITIQGSYFTSDNEDNDNVSNITPNVNNNWNYKCKGVYLACILLIFFIIPTVIIFVSRKKDDQEKETLNN